MFSPIFLTLFLDPKPARGKPRFEYEYPNVPSKAISLFKNLLTPPKTEKLGPFFLKIYSGYKLFK